MADIDYLLSLKGLPTFEAILKLYDEYRKQTPSSRPGELRKIGSGSDAFNRTQRFLTSIRLAKSLMRTDGQGGVLLEPDLAESLFRCIEDLVGDLDRLLAISSQTPSQLSVVLATSQLLGTRPLPPWLREFHSGFESQRGLAGIGDAVPAPRVSMAYAQPYDLTDEFLRDPHVDLVLTYCDPSRKFDDGVQLARVNLHRCMLVRMDHEFAARKKVLETPDGFNFQRDLRGARVAVLSDARVMPGLPLRDIQRSAQVIPVSTTLEAHAHVRARSADLTFSHRELLSEGENKYLTVIDLSSNPTAGRCDLVLLRGRGFPRDDTSDRGKLTTLLANHLAGQMQRMEEGHHAAKTLTSKLERFRFVYHTSDDYRTDPKRPTTQWFRGRLELEATLPFVSRPDRLLWLVKGKHRIRLATNTVRVFDIFGRIQRPDAVSDYHFLWRETQGDDEHGAGTAVFTEDDLCSRDYIVGTWSGRSSWANPGVYIPASGLFIIDSIGNRNETALRRIARTFFNRFPRGTLLERTDHAKGVVGLPD